MARNPVTNERLLAALREMEAEQPGVRQVEFCRALNVSHTLIYQRFGRWPEVRAAAGLPTHVPRRPPRRIADESIRAALRRAVAAFGPDVTLVQFTESEGISRATVAGRFGSWTALRELEGLTPRPRRGPDISDEEIVREYLRFRSWAKRIPSFRELASFSKFSEATWRRRFARFRLRQRLQERCLKAALARIARGEAPDTITGTPADPNIPKPPWKPGDPLLDGGIPAMPVPIRRAKRNRGIR